MINFDALTLKAFVKENENFLAGAVIKKIQQASRREIIFHLRNNGENRKFYININPEFFHICFAEDLQKRGVFIPDSAPMFCMLLRKYIQNVRISKVEQPFGERILEFYFEYRDVLGEVQTLCLAVELMGKYSNVILYNYDTKIIIGCAHNVGEEKSKNRELAGTLPYIYPEKQTKTDILSEDAKSFEEKFSGNFDETSLAYAVSNEYFYLTVPIVKQALESLNIKDLAEINYQNLLEKLKDTVSLKNILPSLNDDFLMFSLVSGIGYNPCKSVNSMINDYFEFNQIQKILKQKKSKICTFLDTKIKKLKTLSENQKNKLLDIEKADNYRIKGDILMMNINIPVAEKVILQNPYDNYADTEIDLDTRFSVVQNANRYYKLYKKTKTAIEYAEEKISEIDEQLAVLEEQKFYAEIASNLDEVDEISVEIGIKSDIPVKKQAKKQINLEMHEIDGFKVYLGKNSIQNDFLLSKIATPEDLWFHPLNMHGAHVILKTNNQKVPDTVLLACAKLAKRFSAAWKDSKIPVIYTERKYVKKANSKLAFVTYKNEREIYC